MMLIGSNLTVSFCDFRVVTMSNKFHQTNTTLSFETINGIVPLDVFIPCSPESLTSHFSFHHSDGISFRTFFSPFSSSQHPHVHRIEPDTRFYYAR